MKGILADGIDMDTEMQMKEVHPDSHLPTAGKGDNSAVVLARCSRGSWEVDRFALAAADIGDIVDPALKDWGPLGSPNPVPLGQLELIGGHMIEGAAVGARHIHTLLWRTGLELGEPGMSCSFERSFLGTRLSEEVVTGRTDGRLP